MSCFQPEEEREAARRSRMIDRQLKQHDRGKHWTREMKVLLLGAGESGKSTFLKQMRIIHGGDYSDQQRLEFRSTIYHNLLKGMKVLVEARKRLQLTLSNPENEAHTETIVSGYHNSQQLQPEDFIKYVEPLKALWLDEGIQNTLSRSNEFQLVRENKRDYNYTVLYIHVILYN